MRRIALSGLYPPISNVIFPVIESVEHDLLQRLILAKSYTKTFIEVGRSIKLLLDSELDPANFCFYDSIEFSIWIVCVDSLWLAVVLVILFFQGFNLISLSDTILLTLLVTTTLNVLGLAYIILEGLFGKSSHNTFRHK